MTENPYEAFTSIYSPSLLAEVNPSLEGMAEAAYSPLTALTTIRPLKAPTQDTQIMLPPYMAQTQPTVAVENLPGTPNYQYAQSSPAARIVSQPQASATPSYSFNTQFGSAPSASQVAPIVDPAVLQAISTAANPVSLGSISPNAPPSAYAALPNPMLQSLGRLNMPQIEGALARAGGAQAISQSAGASFGSAGFMAPKIGNISLIPTVQDIMSVLGPNNMLMLLNQIDPAKFSVTNIQYAPRAALAKALNNLSYSDIMLLMSRMSVQQRMMVYGLLGIPPGEALVIAEQGTQGLFIPSLSNALASSTRKRVLPEAPPLAQLPAPPARRVLTV